MAIIRLGALRFAGLNADVGSLPIDATLDGAIFDATDTTQKYVSDGTQWTEFVSGTGEDNTGANVGVGTGTIFRDKLGVVLNFKSLIGGTNITVTDNADDVTISSSGISPLTTKGDLLGFNTVDDRIPVGTDGQILSANSVNAIGVEWIDDVQEVFTWTANHDMNGFAAEDSKFADGTDPTKIIALDLLGMTTAITLTLESFQSTTQRLLIPNITQADTIVTEKFPQTLAEKTLDMPFISDFRNATHDHSDLFGGLSLSNNALNTGVFGAITGIGVQTQTLNMGENLIDNVATIAVGIINDETNALAAITITDVTAALSFNARAVSNFVFDANGTGNSLDNVEVVDLADATAGELITWDNLGAPDVIAVGISGEILTSNGVGLPPTFQAGPATFQPAYQFAVDNVDLTVAPIDNVWRVPVDFTDLSLMTAYVETAPVGADIQIIVQKNGGSNVLLVIPDGAKTGSSSTFNSTEYTTSDTIGVDVVQIGSTTPGANLKISIIDGVQSSTKSLQFAVTSTGVDITSGLQPDVWRTPTTINTITAISAYFQTPGTGGSTTLEIKKDGVTEGTVTILTGEFTGTTSILNTGTLEFSEEITVDITALGSTPGQNLKVSIIGS